MKILILGRTENLYNTVLLLSKTHDIAGIITAKSSPEYCKNEEDFKELAKKNNCPFIITQQLNEKAKNFIKTIKPDVCVSVNWVSIIKEDVMELIPYGILNAHFGDLPRYRGNAVTNWALINNEKKIVLTVHQMSLELDSGDIWAQKEMEINQSTTINDILKFSAKFTPKLFEKALAKIKENKQPLKQSKIEKTPFRCYPRLPSDSKINWNKSAKFIDRLIRASTHPYSGAYSYLKSKGELKKIYIWNSKVISDSTNNIGLPGHIIKNDKETGETWVFTGKGILGLRKISFKDKKSFKPGKYFKSIRISFNIDIEEEIMLLQNKIQKIIK